MTNRGDYRTMGAVETSEHTNEDQRAEAFRQFHAGHLEAQTKSLETIKTLLILWFLLTIAGTVFITLVATLG